MSYLTIATTRTILNITEHLRETLGPVQENINKILKFLLN